MIPKRIVLENFLSFGSPATEIQFTDDEPLCVGKRSQQSTPSGSATG
jgi:hypothetical protein